MVIYEEIFRAFQQNKVDYVIVGGIALNLLGGSRYTSDLDIIVELSDKNLAKILKILKKMGFRAKLPVDPSRITKKEIREDWIKNKNLKALNFYKAGSMAEVDIIIDAPLSYKHIKKHKVYVKMQKLPLPVVSLDDLIVMKKAAGRDQDIVDVSKLKIIKKGR
jgi:predicted nucleotidyltransferase component of viral defense system